MLDVFAFLSISDNEAIRIAFRDHSEYCGVLRKPNEIGVSFTVRDGSKRGLEMPVEQLLVDGVQRLEIRSDVPAQLDLVLDNPTDANVQAAHTLPQRHRVQLGLAEEKALYNRHFRDDVGELEKLLGRDLSCWYARYDGS